MEQDGSILGTAGVVPIDQAVEAKVVAAILANVWQEYTNAGSKRDAGKLTTMVLEFEHDGKLAATRVGSKYIVAAFGKNIPSRILLGKLEKLRVAFDQALKM